MNPHTDSMHAGIAGVKIGVDKFDFGYDIYLRKTYAHLIAPLLMAFKEPTPDKSDTAPWSAVGDAFSHDIYVELYMPHTFTYPKFFNRLNTIWWIAALIRLRGASLAHASVIANRPFCEIPSNLNKSKIFPVEVLPRRNAGDSPLLILSIDDLEWIKKIWLQGGQVMHESYIFNNVFQSIDSARSLGNSAVEMLTIWGALEQLFSPAKQELRFRVSSNIAAFLEPPGNNRLETQKNVMRLYDARSKIAHGTKLKSYDACLETYNLAKRILIKILSSGHVPTMDDLYSDGIHLTLPPLAGWD
jgi:hypothetical protein